MMSDVLRYALFLVTVFLSNTIQVITGFAGAMLAMPPSIRLIGLESAKAILNIVTMASCIYVVFCRWRKIDYRELLKIILIMGAGMYTGIRLLNLFAPDRFLKCYGCLIIGIALKKLFVHREIALPKIMLYICLFAAGLVHGMFLSGGSFLIVYAVWALPDKEKFRSTVSAVWVVLNSCLLFDHWRAGYFQPHVWKLLLLSLIPFFTAVFLGNRLVSRMSSRRFLLLTYLLLLVSGLLVLV